MNPSFAVGLISGTSADGIDAVVLKALDSTLEVVASVGHTYPADLRADVIGLEQPGDGEIDRMGVVDRKIADCFASAALDVIETAGLTTRDIACIGSHGQTVRHRPDGDFPFTLQLGDPNRIAEATGVITVADFRRRDMAAGGQGAPLAPGFHRAAFADDSQLTALVNLGGIANVSLIAPDGTMTGYDTGPANTLMDYWIRRHRDENFDQGGEWARQGQVNEPLLRHWLQDAFFAAPAPKSTGPEYFSPAWLERSLKADPNAEYRPVDVQRSLLELTAVSVAEAFSGETVGRVALCGGGAHNALLMERLSELLAPTPVVTTETLGVPPDWVEAAAFAWLGLQTLQSLPGNEPLVTGAEGYRVLGAVYPP